MSGWSEYVAGGLGSTDKTSAFRGRGTAKGVSEWRNEKKKAAEEGKTLEHDSGTQLLNVTRLAQKK